MARPSPRGAAAPLAAPAGRDRPAARTPRRHDRRLSQPRRGDPHHPRGTTSRSRSCKARFGLTERAGRLHPRHAAAQLAPARGNGSCASESDDLAKEKRADRGACSASERKQWKMIAVEIRDLKKKYGPETKLGRRRTSFEAAPDVVDGRSRRGDDRARAGDDRGLRERLDTGAERPGRRSRRRRSSRATTD